MRVAAVLAATFAIAAAGSAGAQQASLLLLNGKVWTENPAQPQAQAVAISGDTILTVGSDAELKRLAGPDTKVVNLHGRRVTPGFNDSHVHFVIGGDALASVQLRDAAS